MSISRYARLIFNQMHKLQDKPLAKWIRIRRTGSPVSGSTEEILYQKDIRVLYTEIEVPVVSGDNTVVTQTRTLFYVLKDDFPQGTKPIQNDKIIYKDRTYIIQSISEITDQIYKLSVTLV